MEENKDYSTSLFEIYDHLEFEAGLLPELDDVDSIQGLVELFENQKDDVVPGMKTIEFQDDNIVCTFSVGLLKNINMEKYEELYDFHYFIDNNLNIYVYYSQAD